MKEIVVWRYKHAIYPKHRLYQWSILSFCIQHHILHKMDYDDMLQSLIQCQLDSCCLDVPLKEEAVGIMNTDANNRIVIWRKPAEPKSTKASMGIYILIGTTVICCCSWKANLAMGLVKIAFQIIFETGGECLCLRIQWYWSWRGYYWITWKREYISPENALDKAKNC